MASKVLIKMPVPFTSQIGKKGADIVRSDPTSYPASAEPSTRVGQLEQNIRFLQEQHQIMLSSLHQEIEALRNRNRDLQFQLIFGKTPINLQSDSSDSSPEDHPKPKAVHSPNPINTRSIQVEMLEKEISELKSSLLESNNKYILQTESIEAEKKLLADSIKEKVETEFTTKLEEADKLIKRLVTENEEQRKEITALKNQLSKANGQRYGNGRRGPGGSGEGQHFPPLQHHTYWMNNPPRNKYNSDYGGRRGLSDQENMGQGHSLPHLTRAYSHNSSHNRPRYYSNGNNYYRNQSGEEQDGRRKHGRGRGGNPPV